MPQRTKKITASKTTRYRVYATDQITCRLYIPWISFGGSGVSVGGGCEVVGGHEGQDGGGVSVGGGSGGCVGGGGGGFVGGGGGGLEIWAWPGTHVQHRFPDLPETNRNDILCYTILQPL